MRKYLLLSCSLLLAACGSSSSSVSTRQPLGNPNGFVPVVEYADLQCPACKAAHSGVTKPLLEKYGNDIRFELKHFPLRSIHRYALDAAEAAECAADQGKFWEFIDIAYENQSDLDFDALLVWADELGLDTKSFESCWKSHAKKKVVLADYAEGRELGVGGTPTFFVDGTRVQGGFDTLSAAIEQALGGNQPL